MIKFIFEAFKDCAEMGRSGRLFQSLITLIAKKMLLGLDFHTSVAGLSKWHQIYSGVSLYEGRPRFKFLTRSLKPFPRYESANVRKNFFFFFFFVISYTL